MHLPLSLSPEFAAYNAFNAYHAPDVSHPGHGLGPFYERGSGVIWNGRLPNRTLSGSGFFDSLKSLGKKALSAAKQHVLPALKTGLKHAGKNILKHAIQNAPDLIDAARKRGAKGFFQQAASLLPDVALDTVSDTLGLNDQTEEEESEEGSGIQYDVGPYKHFIKTTIMSLMPLLIHEMQPLKTRMQLLEQLTVAAAEENNDALESVMRALKENLSQAPPNDELINLLYKLTESILDVALFIMSEARHPSNTLLAGEMKSTTEDDSTFYDTSDAFSPLEIPSGGFLQFLPLLGPLIGKGIGALGDALSNIPGPAGQVLGTIGKTVGGFLGGSGIHMTRTKDQRDIHDRNLAHRANVAMAMTLNLPSSLIHSRHPSFSIIFPGLSAFGHSIDTSQILNHHLTVPTLIHIHRKLRTKRQKKDTKSNVPPRKRKAMKMM
jgi:hypothetical protein